MTMRELDRHHDVIRLKPIGFVETEVADEDVPRRRRDMISDVIVLEPYRQGLTGIEAYSHVFILFWMHRASPPVEMLAHPRGDPELPLTGVLAGRGRNHPNPVGLAVVELLARHDTGLRVRRLDAYHGTPVLDIKPYDHYDQVEALREPAWLAARRR